MPVSVAASDCERTQVRITSQTVLFIATAQQLLWYTALGTGCAPLLQCISGLSLPPSVGRRVEGWRLLKTYYHALCHASITKYRRLIRSAVKWVGLVGRCVGTMGWVWSVSWWIGLGWVKKNVTHVHLWELRGSCAPRWHASIKIELYERNYTGFQKTSTFYFWNNFVTNSQIWTIIGMLNPKKIWHERLTPLSTSPVRCSHFTFGNPKSHSSTLSYIQGKVAISDRWGRQISKMCMSNFLRI